MMRTFAFLVALATIAGCTPHHVGNGHHAGSGAAVTTVAKRNGVDVVQDGSGWEAMVDRSGKGPVLCLWSLYVATQEIGNRCFAGKDREFREELDRSITRTEAFIVANSSTPVTQADLRARKEAEAATAAEHLKPERLCKSEWVQLYENFRSAGAAGLKASTDELLSVPREPVINPCI